jgi:hypothetical protein
MLSLVGHDKTKARCVYQETRHAVLYQKIKTTHALVGASFLVIVSMLLGAAWYAVKDVRTTKL